VVSAATLDRDAVLEILDSIKDPEVPVLSVVELGIVRDVAVANSGVTIRVTPTYSGCPAMRVIEDEIRTALAAHGVPFVTLETVYSPAWTTDWLSSEAKRKLEEYGIAPPGRAPHDSLVSLTRAPSRAESPRCPYCHSHDTTLRSEFGSTACKAIAYCNGCQQPFEVFKAL
jgi:ring-1,2-phenylacetyl-CoA epoxidase subunit PaaD